MDKNSQDGQPRSGAQPESNRSDNDFLRANAILSMRKSKPNSGVFDGGEIDAIIGGVELDLRHAAMKHDTARINVYTLFGGVVILVPKEWEVSVQLSAILGGVDDQTAPQPAGGGARPKLVVTGTVIFGGFVVK
jgi:predicted membrane protein